MDVVIAREGLDQGVDRPAELEVAADADREVVEASLELADGHHVQKSLSGVLVAAVARVDDGDIRELRGNVCRAFFVVADGRDIGEAGHDADRVGDALSFSGGRLVCAGETQRFAAQIHHGRFKAETGTGAGLIKERRDLLAVAGMRVFIGVLLDVCSQIKELIEFLSGKIQRCKTMSHEDSFL